jgi:hypothetical protein
VNKRYFKSSWILIIVTSAMGLCLVVTFLLFGSGLAIWFIDLSGEDSSSAAGRPARTSRDLAELPPRPTYTVTATSTSIPTPTPPPSATPTATVSPTPTVSPTDTPQPQPTDTPAPTPRPPTATPQPTDTPSPAAPEYLFTIKETGKFNTTHLNFDVFVAITDDNNSPLSGYRIIGTHDSGLQIESRDSAGAWTENSGAMHYKAGNIKYEAPNSPSGLWTLQLVDSAGQLVGPPVEFIFDPANPTWYFLYFERQ